MACLAGDLYPHRCEKYKLNMPGIIIESWEKSDSSTLYPGILDKYHVDALTSVITAIPYGQLDEQQRKTEKAIMVCAS